MICLILFSISQICEFFHHLPIKSNAALLMVFIFKKKVIGSPADMEIMALKIRRTSCHLFILSLCYCDFRDGGGCRSKGEIHCCCWEQEEICTESRGFLGIHFMTSIFHIVKINRKLYKSNQSQLRKTDHSEMLVSLSQKAMYLAIWDHNYKDKVKIIWASRTRSHSLVHSVCELYCMTVTLAVFWSLRTVFRSEKWFGFKFISQEENT